MMDFDENACDENLARTLNADGIADTYDQALDWVRDIYDTFELCCDNGYPIERAKKMLAEKNYPQEAVDAVIKEWGIESWEW